MSPSRRRTATICGRRRPRRRPNHFDSFTTFVDVSGGKDASVITGVWDAADYALPDSRYFVPVQNGATGTDTRALVAFGTDTRGTCPDPRACPASLDTQAQVGTTFGLAYDKYREPLFQSEFARRYAAYGPDGGGAIYTVPAGGGAPKLFATVPGATMTAHDTGDLIKDPRSPTHRARRASAAWPCRRTARRCTR